MSYPWANILLLLFLALEMVSGFFGLISGSEERAIHMQLHRISGYGILAVLVWKVVNVARSFRWPRPRSVRLASLALAVVLVATLALGLVWSVVGQFGWWMFSGLSWHIYAGAALIPLLLWHSWYMLKGFPVAFWAERRLVLRAGVLALAGLVGWQLTEGIARASALGGSTRRFTGSYEAGSFSGNDFPRVSWLNDRPDRIDSEGWTLRVFGAVDEELSVEIRGACQRIGGDGDDRLHRGVVLDAALGGGSAGRRAVTGETGGDDTQRRRPICDGILSAFLDGGGGGLPAGDARHRRAAVARARLPAPARGARTARVRVGQVGHGDRGERGSRLVAAAPSYPVTAVRLSARPRPARKRGAVSTRCAG